MKLQVKGEKNIRLNGVALSEVQNSSLDHKRNYDSVYRSYFEVTGDKLTPQQFLRSAMIEIKVEEEMDQKNDILLEIPIDYVYSFNK